MDSPFNQGIGRGQSPMYVLSARHWASCGLDADGPMSRSPQTPTGGGSYQVNVNRTKTKKWVEAKIHSYDGDDWGADEYDDEEESEPEPPPVPQLPTKQPAVGMSAAPLPSAPPAHDAVPGLSATGGLPSLQTQQPIAAAPSNQTRSAAITSPVVSDPSTIGSPLGHERVVSPQSIGPGRASTASASQPADTAEKSAGKPLPFVRPSDKYRRLDEEDKERENILMHGPRPNLDSKAGSVGDPVKKSQRDSIGRDDNFQVQSDAAAEFDGDEERRRFSSSPKLPDVARMSTFGPDLFSSTAIAFSPGPAIAEHDSDGASLPSPAQSKTDVVKPGAPVSVPLAAPPPPVAQETTTKKPQPEQHSAPSQQLQLAAQPSSETEGEQEADMDHHSGADKSAEETTKIPVAADTGAHEPREPADVQGVSPISEKHEIVPRATGATTASHAGSQHFTLKPDSDLPAIEPLRTPSPRRPTENMPSQEGPRRTPSNISDRKPVQSVESKPRDQPDQDFEPNPMHRETTFNTVTSSPVKDSDVLSDEILRSLSPSGTAPADPSFGDGGDTLQPGSRNAARESSYTLGDYDSYWADTSDKPEPIAERAAEAKPPAPVVLPVLLDDKHSDNAPPEPSKADEKAVSPDGQGLRRRFSWEADESESMPTPPQLSTSRELPAATVPVVQAEPTPAVPATDAGSVPPRTEAESPKTRDVAPVPIVVSHQVQELPTVQPTVHPTLPEPPSPVSAASEKPAPTVQESKRLSLADEKALSQTTSRLVSPSPPPESHPALIGQSPKESAPPQPRGQQAPAQIMTFREIMGMSTSADRVTKYNETRDYFASTESGLDNWLTSLKDEHPEYANGPTPFSVAAARQPVQGRSSPAPAGAQAPAQQPYYQQYLNASSPTTSTSPSSRSRLGGLQMPTQATGSTFGHSSNQIGTKSKEFMHSAGKMGKGLLSKGKSKLRGSGDKVFH